MASSSPCSPRAPRPDHRLGAPQPAFGVCRASQCPHGRGVVMRKETNWAFFIAGQAGVTPVAFGCPGVAKTASCRALADQTGRRFVSFVLQHHLPEDFGGFPVV